MCPLDKLEEQKKRSTAVWALRGDFFLFDFLATLKRGNSSLCANSCMYLEGQSNGPRFRLEHFFFFLRAYKRKDETKEGRPLVQLEGGN